MWMIFVLFQTWFWPLFATHWPSSSACVFLQFIKFLSERCIVIIAAITWSRHVTSARWISARLFTNEWRSHSGRRDIIYGRCDVIICGAAFLNSVVNAATIIFWKLFNALISGWRGNHCVEIIGWRKANTLFFFMKYSEIDYAVDGKSLPENKFTTWFTTKYNIRGRRH